MKKDLPNADWYCNILQTKDQWKEALKQVEKLKLKPHLDPPKNWDSLAALDYILNHTNKNVRILDAGAEYYSVILPWLRKYKYKELFGINITFKDAKKVDGIIYKYGDITKTDFPELFFDVVTCLSVIEHGVNYKAFFEEMNYIIKNDGILFLSFDYSNLPNSNDLILMDLPWKICNSQIINNLISVAANYNFKIVKDFDYEYKNDIIYNSAYGIGYTFATLTFKKGESIT